MAINGEKGSEPSREKGRYILYPAIACFILSIFGVPYVIYFIPAILLFGLLFASLSPAFTKVKLYLRPPLLFFGLCVAYGGGGFIIPFFAPEILQQIPGSRDWEWPAGGSVSALPLPNDEWAAAVRYAARVQIYDGGGRFLRGWFVPVDGGMFTVNAAPPATDGEEQAALLVSIARGDRALLYTPEGKLITEKKMNHLYDPRGNFKEIPVTIHWYEWPFANPVYAFCLIIAGGLGLGLVEHLEKRGTENDAVPPPAETFDKEARRKAESLSRGSVNPSRLALSLVLIFMYMLGYGVLCVMAGLQPSVPVLIIPSIFIAILTVKIGEEHPTFANARKWLAEGNIDKAVPALYLAEKNEHVGAAVLLGDLYLEGKYAADGQPLAVAHYRKALKNYQNLRFASAVLAYRKSWLDRVAWKQPLREQTAEQATTWIRLMDASLRPLAERGDPAAIQLLADLHAYE